MNWLRRFSVYVNNPDIRNLTNDDLQGYLSYLAVERRVSPATQNQAFNALLFFYRNMLKQEVEGLDISIRSQLPRILPVVFEKDEITLVFKNLTGVHLLMAGIIYGDGLRLHECLSLRIKDIDSVNNYITIHQGKGRKDRQTILSESLHEMLPKHIKEVKRLASKNKLGVGSPLNDLSLKL